MNYASSHTISPTQCLDDIMVLRKDPRKNYKRMYRMCYAKVTDQTQLSSTAVIPT